jgi:glycosyltransferase involved in cell wall biosynthesis
LMRKSDILVLPSIEEGSALVVGEAVGSGCVPVISDASTTICKHMQDSLIHHAGDVQTLTRHITLLHEDRGLLEKLRAGAIRAIPEITWTAAGVRLENVYREVIAASGKRRAPSMVQTARI